MAEKSKYGGVPVITERAQVEELTGKDLLKLESEYGGVPITDPVGLAQYGAERAMSGEGVPSERIPDLNPLTDYPMEPGTSRASRELPEAFAPTLEMGVWDPGESGGFQISYPRFRDRPKGGIGSDFTFKEAALISTAALTTFDPQEIADMLQATGKVAIQYAPDGAIVATNKKSGAQAVINRPGASGMDFLQLAGLTAAFTPAGRAATAPAALFPRMVVGGAAAATTEAGLQQLQEAAGGQFDEFDVALSGAMGPLAELGRPALGLMQRTGKFIGSYLPENMFGGLEAVIPQAKAAALNFSKTAKEYLESGRNAIVTTQDAVQETMKPYKQILLKMVERLPITGTGGLRAAQREQRVEVLRRLGERYGLNPNTNYGARVLDSLSEASGAQLDAANRIIANTTEQLADNPVVIRDFRLKVKELIDQQNALGEMKNPGVIKLLNKVRNAVWVGGEPKPGKLPRGFGEINDWLDRLYAESANAPPAAREAIEEAADALRRDLERTAMEVSPELGAQYARATRSVESLVKGTERKTLAGLIEAGEVDEQVMRKALNSGDQGLITQLVDNLTPEGVESARQMVLRNAMRRSGWTANEIGEAAVDPKKFLTHLETESVDQQLKALFPEGTPGRGELEGMKEYLRLTAATQELGKGTGMAAAIGTVAFGAIDILSAGVIGALGHAYQSAPVRNLLLRLHHVKGNQRATDAIMEQLEPLLMAGGRQMLNEWTAVEPQDQVYLQDLFPEMNEDLQAGGPGGLGTEHPLAQDMEELRAASGAQEEQGITQRLMQMLGMGD